MRGTELVRAAAYVRDVGSLSHGAQRRTIERWARGANTSVACWYVEEARYATIDERPVLLEALASLAKPDWSVLCVASREVASEAPWERAIVERLAAHVGGRVVYASQQGMSANDVDDLRTVLDAHERIILRFRTILSREIKQPRGALWGRCPWGYRFSPDGMRLEPYEPEQLVVAVVRHMRLRGLKLRVIADELRKLGVVGRTGKPLGVTRIFELLDEGEGSRPNVLMKKVGAEEDDEPPESGVVDGHSPAVPARLRHARSLAK